MDIEKINCIIDKLNGGNISKFEYQDKDFKILIEKNVLQKETVIEKDTCVSENKENKTDAANTLKSPIVGTFYSKASPESTPFVNVGDVVKKGDTVCIIEAMKLFNEVASECDGVVKEIFLNDGDIVSFEQPIMIIE